jgi:flavin-dependent dehydrogenase
MNLSDVIVIGGGPAGSTAASLLAAWGHRVTLLARAFPTPTLAESVPPSCAKLLDRIGVRGAIDSAGFVRSTGNTVWWGSHDGRAEAFGDGRLGYQVPRAALDDLLLARAEGSGAEVVRDAVAMDVVMGRSGDSYNAVAYEAAGSRRTIGGRWLLDCSGRAGLIARRGWRRVESGGRTLAIVGIWEQPGGWGLADGSHTLVESYDAGWAWSVPITATRRYVTVMVDPTLTSIGGRGALAATYRRELARTRRLGPLASEGAVLVGHPWARDASPYSAVRASDDGLLLVGDAASFVDPLSSFGIKKALASAWLAAVVAHTSLVDPSRQHAARVLFEAREREMYGALAQRTASLAREAVRAFPDGFWSERGDAIAEDAPSTLDVDGFRRDPGVLAAFEDLRARPAIHLRPTRALRRADKPVVRGNEVVVEPHLVAPAFPDGVRYLRSVDLVKIMELGGTHDQVPDLYEAYNRAAPPVALGDFLGALSVLVGKGLLHHS